MLDEPRQLEEVLRLPDHEVGLGVLGYPISHSLSPRLHTAALSDLSSYEPKFRNWHYSKFELPPERLKEALPIFWEAGYYGLNLTVPHKVDALSLIDSIDSEAKVMGAVNTLVRKNDGWHGLNTDGYGLRSGLKENLKVDLSDARILILGAGGAARAAAAECIARGCRELWMANRSTDRLNQVIEVLQRNFQIEHIFPFQIGSPPQRLLEVGNLIVINATSLGLRDDDPSPFDLSRLSTGTRVFEMIYNPPKTKLLLQAEELGFDCSSGLSMLVHQAAKALEVWTQREIKVSVMYKAVESI